VRLSMFLASSFNGCLTPQTPEALRTGSPLEHLHISPPGRRCSSPGELLTRAIREQTVKHNPSAPTHHADSTSDDYTCLPLMPEPHRPFAGASPIWTRDLRRRGFAREGHERPQFERISMSFYMSIVRGSDCHESNLSPAKLRHRTGERESTLADCQG
jgi:hypothetical protein